MKKQYKILAASYIASALFIVSGLLGGVNQSAPPEIPVPRFPTGLEQPSSTPSSDASSASSTPSSAAPPPDFNEPAESVMAAQSTPLDSGGTVIYTDGSEPLNPEQETLLTDYMNMYYTSLALLEPQDSSHLFAEGADTQIANDRAVLATQIGIRSMQQTDLSLSGYSFELTVQSATADDSGDIRIRASEDSIQNFTAYPGVESAGYDISHTFLLTETGGSWRIKEHRQMGSLYRLVMGQGVWQPGSLTAAFATPSDAGGNVSKLLADAREDVTRRTTRGNADADIRFDNAYDRAAAVRYAREWSSRRNPDWPSYDRLGGNCQNFTSQAIFAGGIPMDYTAPGQWKWYGDTPNGNYVAAGRSPAWSGVSEFLSYVQANSGYGMVALADAPYYSGEVGDVIHMGVGGDWRHTVIITEVLKDADGKTVDYLIASNTLNLRDFPVSAYYYTDQMLIKIYGWNN